MREIHLFTILVGTPEEERLLEGRRVRPEDLKKMERKDMEWIRLTWDS
jgi:hypothetical protein